MTIQNQITGLLIFWGAIALSCQKPYHPPFDPGDWLFEPPFEGLPRAGAVSFAIGSRAYVGLGCGDSTYQSDFYVYDVNKLYWDSMASFPGTPREQAVAFSINGKGYVGTGFNRDSSAYYKDFWEYNPSTYQWRRLDDFPGNSRANAVGFDDGTYGYLGTGFDGNYYGDFWQYDPSMDNWKLIPSYRGDRRAQAMTFNVKGKTYLFGGTIGGSFTYDIWEFDPSTLTWTDRTPLTTSSQHGNFKIAVSRYDAAAFALNNKGYISTGSNGSILNSTYQYDPSNQTFIQMAAFERSPRKQAIAFVVKDEYRTFRAFVSTGSDGTNRFDDMMQFHFVN